MYLFLLVVAMALVCAITGYATPVMDESAGEGELIIHDDTLTNTDNAVYIYEGDEEASIEPYASVVKLQLSIADYLSGSGLLKGQLLTTRNRLNPIKIKDFNGNAVRIRLTDFKYESTGYIRGGLATYNSANATFDAQVYLQLEADGKVQGIYDTFEIAGSNLEMKRDAQMYAFIKNLTGGEISRGVVKIIDYNI